MRLFRDGETVISQGDRCPNVFLIRRRGARLRRAAPSPLERLEGGTQRCQAKPSQAKPSSPKPGPTRPRPRSGVVDVFVEDRFDGPDGPPTFITLGQCYEGEYIGEFSVLESAEGGSDPQPAPADGGGAPAGGWPPAQKPSLRHKFMARARKDSSRFGSHLSAPAPRQACLTSHSAPPLRPARSCATIWAARRHAPSACAR